MDYIDDFLYEARILAKYCKALNTSIIEESTSEESQSKEIFERLEDKIRNFSIKVDMKSANKLKSGIDKQVDMFTKAGITKFTITEHIELYLRNFDKLEKKLDSLLKKGNKILPEECDSLNEIYNDYIKTSKTNGKTTKEYNKTDIEDMSEELINNIEYWLDVFKYISKKLKQFKHNDKIEAGKAYVCLAETASRCITVTYATLYNFSKQLPKSTKK